MKLIKYCRFIFLLNLFWTSLSYADITGDVMAFMQCHGLKGKILNFYSHDGNFLIQTADTTYSFPKSADCSMIKVESVIQHPCMDERGTFLCYVVAQDVMDKNKILALNYPANGFDGFYLKYLDGKKVPLKGEMLWGLGRKYAFMKNNIIVLMHRNENKCYELITYKIENQAIKELKREKYPYELSADIGGWPKDCIIPCDGKMCIYNGKKQKVYTYKNEFLND